MSFASSTKENLLKLRLRGEEKQALLWGMTAAIGTVVIRHGQGIGIKYTLESAHGAKLLSKLSQELYPLDAELTIHESNTGLRSKNMVLYLFGTGVRSLVRDSMFMDAHVPFEALSSDKLRRVYLRGVFLACGYVTAPEKGYHLELDLRSESLSYDLTTLCESLELTMKQSTRRGHYQVYAKDSSVICDFLTNIGASDSTLEFESVKAYKDTRNYANRTRNCDVANIERSAQASLSQVEAINRLIDSGVELKGRLLITAQARINNPDASLTELASILGIGKSGVHHRIKSLMDMADALETTDNAQGIKNGETNDD